MNDTHDSEAMNRETPENTDIQEDMVNTDKKSRSLLLTFLQTGTCVIFLAAAAIIRLIGGSIYSTAAAWFYDHYNDSVFPAEAVAVLPFSDPVAVVETSTVAPGKLPADGAALPEKFKKSFTAPVRSGKIIKGFGVDGSKGVDISATAGDVILAALDGTVIQVDEENSQNKSVILSHSDGVRTIYSGIESIAVKKGDKIKAGDRLGKIQASGEPVVHFELIVNGSSIDPEPVGIISSAESGKSQ